MVNPVYLVYQLKVTLKDSNPPIWRRIQVPANISLGTLHTILQIVMGWENEHPHVFQIGREAYTSSFDIDSGWSLEEEDEDSFRLDQVLYQEGQRFEYEYDFGDGWVHQIVVEKILFQDVPLEHPICLDGERACPPEDIGGIWGYEDFLNALSDPDHPQHNEFSQWYGGDFDPEAFDLEEVNAQLGELPLSLLESWSELDTFVDQPESIAKYWKNAFDPEVQEVGKWVYVNRLVQEMLNYFRDHKVIAKKSNGELPLRAIKHFVRQLILLMHGEVTAEDEENIQKIRKQSDVLLINLALILIESGYLAISIPGHPWHITSLGERFLAAPVSAQLWYLFLNWWLKTDWSQLVDEPAIQMMVEGMNLEIVREVLMRIREVDPQEMIDFDEMAASMLGELMNEINTDEITAMVNASFNLIIWLVILLPLREFRVIEMEELPTVDREESLFRVPKFRLHAAQKGLLEGFLAYLDEIYSDPDYGFEDDFNLNDHEEGPSF